MGARLYNTHKIVERLLQAYPDTRDNDELLYLKTCKAIRPDMANMTFENVILDLKVMGLPKYKSVERARRKIQKDNPDLRASEEVQEMRYEEYKNYKEYALS